jgi:hypothetical protein
MIFSEMRLVSESYLYSSLIIYIINEEYRDDDDDDDDENTHTHIYSLM